MKEIKSTIEKHGDKFIITDVDEIEINKTTELEKIMLADGKSFIPCVSGLATGTIKTNIIEKGDKYVKKITTTIKLSSSMLLRLATSIRAMRDFTKQSKEAYDYFKDRTEKFESFVKEASLINKKIEMITARRDKKNNKETR